MGISKTGSDWKCAGKFMRKNNISRDENKRSEKCCTNLIWYAIIKTAFVPISRTFLI